MSEPTQVYGSTGYAQTSQFEKFGYSGTYNKVVKVQGVTQYDATGSNFGAMAFVVDNSTGVFLYPAAGGGPLSGSLFNVTDKFTVNEIGISKVNITNSNGIVYILYYK